MLHYLKAAFWVRRHIPPLGGVPVNGLAVACFAILGLGHPAFWLIGLGLETAFLAALSTNARFQRLVDAEAHLQLDNDAGDKRRALINQLPPEPRARLDALDSKCQRALDLKRKQDVEEYLVDSDRDSLEKLTWLYLRLLTGQQYLLSQESQTTERKLRDQTAAIQRELHAGNLAPSLRESKTATLRILEKRLENLERREQALKEIDSDLTRIEAQVDLAVENASLSGQSEAVSSNITLVSHLLDPELFGDSQRAIADLDRTYGPPPAARETA